MSDMRMDYYKTFIGIVKDMKNIRRKGAEGQR
jgi:hypothetical protein